MHFKPTFVALALRVFTASVSAALESRVVLARRTRHVDAVYYLTIGSALNTKNFGRVGSITCRHFQCLFHSSVICLKNGGSAIVQKFPSSPGYR